MVVVVGAGIAGLTVAHELQKRGLRTAVYETREQPGGVIRSERTDGYLIEHGPNSIQPTPEMEALFREIGLERSVVEANPAQRNRFVVRRGKLVPVPLGPGEVFRTGLFSWQGKLRLLLEPFVRRAKGPETVASFVRRRVGNEFLDYAINPFVAGVFAGDPEHLSMQHAFPRMVELERQHGSLIRGMMARKQSGQGGARKRLLSFADGMQELPLALARQLGDGIRYNQPVHTIKRAGQKWTISIDPSSVETADAVVSTVPIPRLLGLLRVPPSAIPQVTYAPVTIAALGYKQEHVAHPLDGFGVLVPEVEDRFRILGALFSSTLFPARAPEGNVLITVFLGGMRHRHASYLNGDDAVAVAHHDLSQLLSIEGLPVFSRVAVWPQAIPQYEPGYERIEQALDDLETRYPGLFLAGNFRGGISVVDTMTSAVSVAKRVSAYVKPT